MISTSPAKQDMNESESTIDRGLAAELSQTLAWVREGVASLAGQCGSDPPGNGSNDHHAAGQGIQECRRVEKQLASCCERLEQLVTRRSDELLAAQRQILQNEKLASVGQLAAGIAHEINTPTQYIGDNLRALKDFFADVQAMMAGYETLVAKVQAGQATPVDVEQIETLRTEHDIAFIMEDIPKAIQQSLEGVDRVSRIVRAMRSFSYDDRSQAAFVDINHALDSTLTVARNEYKYCADLETDYGELPTVECYPGELNQVFLNILINAAHAIQDTGQHGRITVRTRVLGDVVEVAISDTGTGIPPEYQASIFDPFFTTKDVGRGTGQGLSIAHQIVVRKHAGELFFKTGEGQGTTFHVRLPQRMASAPAGPEEA